MNEPGPSTSPASPALAWYAKFVVFMLFFLIMVGGHTTTAGAGMAFPDWPLSAGSFNPDGWWENFMQRLEHGHRLTAGLVGLLIGILCSWIWRSKWSIPISFGVSAVLTTIARMNGVERPVVVHTGLWSAAITFALIILWRAERRDHLLPAPVRWLAFAAFLGVLAQAVLGGFRVTIESGGNVATATTFRVLHGCFAQLELCIVVALTAMLSPVWARLRKFDGARGVAIAAWIAAGFIFLQLIVGASMRHLGAGLAIPTWPQANAAGGWMPAVHNVFVDLNFTHTRVGAVLVSLIVLGVALRTLGFANGHIRIIRPAALLLGLVIAQFAIGVFVIWKGRPPVLTTLHVVNGAALLATAVLLAVRAGRGVPGAPEPVEAPGHKLAEVAA